MRPRREFTEKQREEVKAALKTSHDKEEYQRVQAVWLRMELGLNASEIARILGIHTGSVWRIHSRFFHEGASVFRSGPHGGRYKENMRLEDEKRFLSPFIEKTSRSGVLVVSGIKLAYEKTLGHKVPKSTIYRMLERNGWRKIMPRPSHPVHG